MSVEKLGQFLREVSNWRWDEFVRAEKDSDYTTNQALIFALVRSCAMEQQPAIKMALNRLDGKLKTPIKIEYPKIYWLFPYAEQDVSKSAISQGSDMVLADPNVSKPQKDVSDYEEDREDLPSLTLRETLNRMSDFPREIPAQIAAYAMQVDQANRGQGQLPDDIPLVKSVIAAHLLIMAQNKDIAAIGEVFDQIDGKLAETIQIVGEDLFLTSYSKIAPENAYINADGVLQSEAEQVTNTWAARLGKGNA